ncbi:zinc-dependent alcohol dehydrogenase family protein [Thalassococcus sp. BH17M4-6]|uniref:zinc-dependent alcohol dehydrogenase family protein n=1 Tax=Thalassococcus sp. BH17M4-6 TaxID=3413148 RepID=UPI003BC3FDCE
MAEQVFQNSALRYAAFGDPRKVLRLESGTLPPVAPDALRIEMRYAPINPSDLIPITGAYSHLITPPMTAGYEGVGRVVSAPAGSDHASGQRVLALRGAGTWQRFVDCDPAIAVPVPDDIPDTVAARAYINPLSALHLLRLWPVAGKHVMLTGAGSYIAALLAQWAYADGAASVTGVYRSPERLDWLRALGVQPLAERDSDRVVASARQADIVFDAVGGSLGSAVLGAMRSGTDCVGYGLLSGQPVLPPRGTLASHRRFHLRDVLRDMDAATWQDGFVRLWPRLRATRLPGTQEFEMARWREALDAFDAPGRWAKPLLRLGPPGTRNESV